MARMQFWAKNELDTTTSVAVSSNTTTAQYLFNRNRNLGYSSLGQGTDGTAVTITVTVPTGTVLSVIGLISHNMKSFRVFYDSATANSLFSTTTNSASSTLISFSSVTVGTITLEGLTTQTADEEKEVGELYVGYLQLEFERNPDIRSYKPTIFRKQIKHQMPDGGIVLYNVKDKFRADLRFNFITTTFKNDLEDVHNAFTPSVFVPFPTTTAWDGDTFEVVSTGDFDFKFSDNVSSTGWTGSMRIEETPGG